MKTKLIIKSAIIGLMLVPFVGISQKEEGKKFKFVKVSRDVKKEAKSLAKEGWDIAPGALPLNKMLEKSYQMQVAEDENGFPSWIVASGNSVAQTQSSAQMQAIEVASNLLARLIESDMRSVIESEVANNQISSDEAVSFNKAIQVAVNKVAKTMNRVNPVVELYRSTKNKNTECQVFIAYNYDLARQSILDEAKLALQVEAEDMHEKYDEFLNPEFYDKGEIHNYAK